MIAAVGVAGTASAGLQGAWFYGLVQLQTQEQTAGASCWPTGPTTYECTLRYEIGALGDAVDVQVSDPGGLADDEQINAGGAILDGGLSERHLSNGGDYGLDLPLGSFKERIVINDDSGRRVAGFYCTDKDNDNLCGDWNKGEIGQAFCGETTIWEPVVTTSIFAAAYFTEGPAFQQVDCGPEVPLNTGSSSGTIHVFLEPWTYPVP